MSKILSAEDARQIQNPRDWPVKALIDPNVAEHRRALERAIAPQLIAAVLVDRADPVETSEKARRMLDTLLGAAPTTKAAPAPAAVEPVAADDFQHEQMDALALARYKVVPSDQSMFWRYAVAAGDGQQHLYNGSEVDCQNIARKFAGAFLDGAFVYHTRCATPTTPKE